MKSKILWNLCTVSLDWLYCCDITDVSRVSPEMAAYNKLIKTLKNHSSWSVYQNLPNLLLIQVCKIIFHSPNLHKCLLGKLLLKILANFPSDKCSILSEEGPTSNPAFRRGPVCRGQFGEVLSFLRPTVQTIMECPRLLGTITVEWFLLCAPALR